MDDINTIRQSLTFNDRSKMTVQAEITACENTARVWAMIKKEELYE